MNKNMEVKKEKESESKKKNKYRIYVSSRSKFGRIIVNKEESRLPNWTPLTKIQEQREIKKICDAGYGSDSNCLVWKGTNKLEFYQQKDKKSTFILENEEIKDIQSTLASYIVLTISGKVFSLANSTFHSYSFSQLTAEIPFIDYEKSTFKAPRMVTFFNDQMNDLKVDSIQTTVDKNYFLCNGGKLYGNGHNDNGYLGDETKISKHLPCLIYENVTKMFGGLSNHFFFTTSSNELYVFGQNNNGQLGMGNKTDQIEPQKVENWKANDILDIRCFVDHSVLITKEGKAYSCGCKEKNGIGEDKSIFTIIPLLKDEKVIKINGFNHPALVLTNNNELFGWNFTFLNSPTEQYNDLKVKKWNLPRKINLPDIYQNNLNLISLDIYCGINSIILHPRKINSLIHDFRLLLESKKYCDSKISCFQPNNKKSEISIPVHKIFIELRTNLKLNKIQTIITENNFSKEDINEFLIWVYCDQIRNSTIIKQIFDCLNLAYPPPKNKLDQDLLKLFNDEESKDFTLLIKSNQIIDEKIDEKGGKEDLNEQVENYEMIKVHKIILLIRSGLFRDMFDTLNEKEKNINKIQDYTGKSKKSLEILIKYFYTNKIKLTANDDLDLIFEELKDSIEYYQLHRKSNFIKQLNKIQKLK
ncbi:rcc1 and btb domain containing protein [Anaeramoeba flamelloides]|uniref:Rcc1 and btb domain containing protein n=1 Tax=Anaeramoeba flamelloides TaxID=1746091 RepID=A0ABQ8X1U5_9EUKA|nr:rcc1 and btb domain containing protein [Anaeramoeba flamelloides]